MTDLIEALRALHAPSREPYEQFSVRPGCGGCDYGGYEAEAPEWPCRTALLLWTEAEREPLLAAWRAWRDTERRRKPPADPSPTGRAIADIWEARITETLNANWMSRIMRESP